MALKELAKKYYAEQSYNCAESILLAGNELYQLELSKEDIHLISGFGGGCGCGKICGAVAGCIAMLGRLQITDKAHTTPNFAANCASFIEAVEAEYGSSNCADLKPKFMNDQTRCLGSVEAIADVFEQHLVITAMMKK